MNKSNLSDSQKHLLKELLDRNYDEKLCEIIVNQLNSDISANRMIGYLYYHNDLPIEEVVDEMLAIISDRDAWIKKKNMEYNQAKWNQYLNDEN